MTALIAGVDLSTHHIDVALIPIDPDHGDPTCPPVTWRRVAITADHRDTGHRCYQAAAAARTALTPIAVPGTPGHTVESAWVEEPWGPYRNIDRALLPIYGSVCVGAYRATKTVATIATIDWRPIVGLTRGATKERCQAVAADWYRRTTGRVATIPATDHNAAEALLIALAGRTLTWRRTDPSYKEEAIA